MNGERDYLFGVLVGMLVFAGMILSGLLVRLWFG